MKKIFITLCSIIVTFSLSTSVLAIEAVRTTSRVMINGEEVAFEAYNVEGSNYFKLRDLAYALNGTDCQFSIGYDAVSDSIYLTSKQAYVAVGGELQNTMLDTIEIKTSSSTVIKDGETTDISAYNINGNNYFKLRDLGKEVAFDVNYDASDNSVIVETKKTIVQTNAKLDEEGFATDLYTIATPPTPVPVPR